MAIIYAFCGLVCAALNDFIMKLVARKQRSRGLFFCLVGVCWGAMCLFFPMSFSRETLIWGCSASTFSLTANLLLIESMGMQSAGICSTVYRLNLVPVAVLACFLPYLNESITWYNGVGIAFAAAAVLCFMSRSNVEAGTRDAAKLAKLGLFLVIVASFLRAGQGLSSKYANVFEADLIGVIFINAVFWAVGGLIYALIRERKIMSLDSHITGYSIISSIAVFGILFFMLASTKEGKAAIVLPIQQMSFPLTLILSVLFLHEKVTAAKLTGIACSIAAVVLLCLK